MVETTGEPVADTAFVDEVSLPYVVYLDTVGRKGPDTKNMIKNHSLTVERYSSFGEGDEKLEKLFDAQAVEYTKEKMWLKDRECFMATYDLDLIEKT
jgi:hypothetical protein